VTDLEQHEIPLVPAAAGALIFDRHGRLLILKTTYQSGWTIPGGMIEADGESPWEACRREVLEETGLNVQTARLTAVDFRPAKPGRIGGVRFLFDCGALTDAELSGIVLQESEIEDSRITDLATAFELLSGPLRRRVREATRRSRCVYLENGREVPAVHTKQRSDRS
jgi:8-oxo-dGTP pyrophosphatase MutT (NUDIX family)